jgi:ectoine hydroxylase-related dioxygenase (phytanoyl-CoA dioxygenase family)
MLAEQAIDQLGRDGFVAARRVLDEAQLAAAREAADALLAEHGARSGYGVIALEAWRRSPAFRELLAPLASVACEALGTDVLVVFQDLVIDKPPSSETFLPWHQDGAYLPLDRVDGVVGWVALDDADAERGCLRYVAGSHRLGRRRGPAEFSPSHEPPDGDLRPIDADGRPVVVAEAAAGDAWLHTPLTWHASPPNRVAASRRAWNVWFVREDTRWAPDRAPHPYVRELQPIPGAPLAGDRFPRLSR